MTTQDLKTAKAKRLGDLYDMVADLFTMEGLVDAEGIPTDQARGMLLQFEKLGYDQTDVTFMLEVVAQDMAYDHT